MKIHPWVLSVRSRYAGLPPRQQGVAIAVVAFAGILCITFLYHVFVHFHKNKWATEPLMIRSGNLINIPKNSPLRLQMTVKPVVISTAPHMVSFPGVVEADPAKTVNILPPLTGRLVRLNAGLGDFVKKNQVLAEIRSPDLAAAYADNETAQGAFALASAALKRAKQVNLAGANALKDIQLAESNYIQALAERKRAAARLKTLGNNTFSLLTIQAPIAGTITALNYGEGSYITDVTAPLLTLSNITSVWVTANIPEHLAGVVAKEQRVEVFLSAYPKRRLLGKVSFVSTFLDADTRRNKTLIVFKNLDGKLQPNMFATVKIAIPQSKKVVIPISSILMNDDTTSVFIEKKPWVFERRAVKLGAEDGELVRVLSGVSPGERIVTCGGIFVND